MNAIKKILTTLLMAVALAMLDLRAVPAAVGRMSRRTHRAHQRAMLKRYGLPTISGGMARLSERFQIVYANLLKDHGGAVATADSINMGKLFRVMYLLQFGATITGNAALTLKSGATDGTQTTAETFRYRLADQTQATSGADQYADWATSSSLTLTAATYASKLLIVEIDSDELTAGQPWLTLECSNITALNMAVVAIGDPRIMANDNGSVTG